MDIIKIQGTDKKLYEMVGSLVMSPAILRQNNNYPFKTGLRYVWYIAVEGEQVEGFMPVKGEAAGGNIIDNYYIRGDNAAVISKLLAKIIADGTVQDGLWAVVHKRHVEHFARNGFRTHVAWKKYDKMQFCRKAKSLCAG